MIKPDSLREHLLAAVPALKRDPERLLVFIDEGHLHATAVPNLSFEYRYQLQLVITDFQGHPDAVMVPLIAWLATQQSELLANPERRDGIRFEADVLANNAVDLSITLPLTERVGVHPRPEGGYDVTHYPEPKLESPLRAGRWEVYLRDEYLGGFDVERPTP